MSDLRTEAEATALSCPFFRYVINEYDVQQNGANAIYIHQTCMASACIAWRRGPPRVISHQPRPKREFRSIRHDEPMPEGFERLGIAEWPPGAGAPNINIRTILPEAETVAQGFCGIAGKPEFTP